MAKGDEALAGREERDIASHRFLPSDKDRKIKFKGLYISVYNEKTEDLEVREENVKEYKEYNVPKGYTTYVRGVKIVSFKKI